jgi:hypothetical protein
VRDLGLGVTMGGVLYTVGLDVKVLAPTLSADGLRVVPLQNLLARFVSRWQTVFLSVDVVSVDLVCGVPRIVRRLAQS